VTPAPDASPGADPDGRRVAGVDPPSPAPAAVAGPGTDVRARLRLALTGALRARDAIAVSALRSALSATGNAEAVDPGPAATTGPGSTYVAGAAAGLGTTEARRRSLSTAQAEQIVRAEAGERERAARDYERAGHADQADRLRREALVLMAVVAAGDRPGDGASPTSREPSGPPPGLA
jgi:uncharacterized protein